MSSHRSPCATETGAVAGSAPAQLTFERALNAPQVAPRADAIVDPDIVRVREDAAVKYNAQPSRPGYPSGMSDVETHLHVEAWLRNLTYAKHVWIDAHVLDDTGALVRAESLPLRYARPAGDGGDVFVLDRQMYQGSVATEGSVEPRPDARAVEYRIYGEMGGRVFTDGVAHRCELKPDYTSR